MLTELLSRVAAALDLAAIPYMVIGGQAVLLHGEPRFTRDIDITLGVGTEAIDRLLLVIDELGLRPLPDDPRTFVAQTLVLPAVDDATGIRLDMILSSSGYEAQAIERALSVTIGDRQVRFATAEDLIVHKIVAGRPRDLEDVRGVLLRNPGLDRAYVRRWLRQFEEAAETDEGGSLVGTFERIAAELR